MFTAKFISVNRGRSKESGIPWFRVEMIADTVNGNNKVLQAFCTENAYNGCASLKSMQDVKVGVGVNDNGYLVINVIKAAQQQ